MRGFQEESLINVRFGVVVIVEPIFVGEIFGEACGLLQGENILLVIR